MRTIRVSFSKSLVIAGIAVLVITGAVIGLWQGTEINRNGASTQAVAQKSVGNEQASIKYTSLPVEAFYREVATIDAAKSEVAFNPRIPDSPPGRTLKKIQVNKFPKEHRVMRLDYGDIIVLISPSDSYADYEAQANENPNIVKRASINGNPGIEIEQGWQDVPENPEGKKHHYPTVVGWYENGVKYTVYSYNQHLDEVRAFAKTMFKQD